MKNKKTILKTVLLCAFIILLFSCNKDVVEPTPPTVDYSTFTDARDGKIYKTIKIKNQEWMAENLSFETSSGSWIYWNAFSEGIQNGRLYTWEAAQQAAPAGYHLPTDSEWKQLEISLGMSKYSADSTNFRGTNEGTFLKATSKWAENGNGTDTFGFSALPAGFRSNIGNYLAIHWQGYWWTASESDTSSAWVRYISTNNTKVSRNISFKGDGYSVRCVKN